MVKKEFKIKGMHCESCIKLITIELKEKTKKLDINLKTGNANIDFDENKISEKEIKKAIENLGYKII